MRPVVLALLVAACSPTRAPGDLPGSTGEACEPGTDGCACLVEGDGCFGDLVCSGNVCVDPTRTTSEPGSSGEESSSTSTSSGSTGGPASMGGSTGEPTLSTGAPDTCGDGVVDPGEECDDGAETQTCDIDCTIGVCGDGVVNTTRGEECDDGNDDDSDNCIHTCGYADCGDGYLWSSVEECDDGNVINSDGCSSFCDKERWSHVGVAQNIPLSDLYLWDECWSSNWDGGEPVDALYDACPGDHLLIGCRPTGALLLSLAAHAPRADVLFIPEVDYQGGERHEANGVAWYWAPLQGILGFGPGGNSSPCTEVGQDEQMCWKMFEQKLAGGGRCGSKLGFSDIDEPLWERVIFQGWD